MAREDPYPPGRLIFETAAEHACTRVPVVSPASRIADIRRSFEGKQFDSATHVAVCEDRKLVGIMTIEELLSAPGQAVAGDLMDSDPPVVASGVDQEKAAWQAVQHGESALAVVDSEDRFVGFIPPHRLLAVLLWEHEEDMARLGGFLRDTSSARSAIQEAVMRRLWHRLPWLLAGLAGALFAADIVGLFQKTLEANVLLAFFIPGIVYLADAVGTQTEALVIRGLSVGVEIRQIVQREILTGLFVGLALAALFFPMGLWRWGDRDVALAVSITLLGACSTATFVAMALPWIFHRLGKDPAFGSGPLATVIQDLLSILIYFSVATFLV